MPLLDQDPIDPEIAATLDAIDATLAGEPVDGRYADVAEIALLLASDRPQVPPAFARSMDQKVERRFARAAGSSGQAPRRRRRWSRDLAGDGRARRGGRGARGDRGRGRHKGRLVGRVVLGVERGEHHVVVERGSASAARRCHRRSRPPPLLRRTRLRRGRPSPSPRSSPRRTRRRPGPPRLRPRPRPLRGRRRQSSSRRRPAARSFRARSSTWLRLLTGSTTWRRRSTT